MLAAGALQRTAAGNDRCTHKHIQQHVPYSTAAPVRVVLLFDQAPVLL